MKTPAVLLAVIVGLAGIAFVLWSIRNTDALVDPMVLVHLSVKDVTVDGVKLGDNISKIPAEQPTLLHTAAKFLNRL